MFDDQEKQPRKTAPIVYVRSVDVQDLPDEVRAQSGGAKSLYAIHNTDGQCLALAPDRERAFVVARMNEMAPVKRALTRTLLRRPDAVRHRQVLIQGLPTIPVMHDRAGPNRLVDRRVTVSVLRGSGAAASQIRFHSAASAALPPDASASNAFRLSTKMISSIPVTVRPIAVSAPEIAGADSRFHGSQGRIRQGEVERVKARPAVDYVQVAGRPRCLRSSLLRRRGKRHPPCRRAQCLTPDRRQGCRCPARRRACRRRRHRRQRLRRARQRPCRRQSRRRPSHLRSPHRSGHRRAHQRVCRRARRRAAGRLRPDQRPGRLFRDRI